MIILKILHILCRFGTFCKHFAIATSFVIISALNNEDFMVNTMADAEKYYYKP